MLCSGIQGALKAKLGTRRESPKTICLGAKLKAGNLGEIKEIQEKGLGEEGYLDWGSWRGEKDHSTIQARTPGLKKQEQRVMVRRQ